MWGAIGVASLGLHVEKLAGYLLPARLLDRERVRRVSSLLPLALLAAIIAVQAVTSGRSVHPDARLPGLAVALVLLARRTNFLLMVIGAAATTGLVRHLGWMA